MVATDSRSPRKDRNEESPRKDKNPLSPRNSPRKTKKPQMEKKRRDRINYNLDQLRELVLDKYPKDANLQSQKMEKASILEMTVRHLERLESLQKVQAARRYQEGFRHCAQEVMSCLSSTPGMTHDAMARMQHHLNYHMQTMDVGPLPVPSLPLAPLLHFPPAALPPPPPPPLPPPPSGYLLPSLELNRSVYSGYPAPRDDSFRPARVALQKPPHPVSMFDPRHVSPLGLPSAPAAVAASLPNSLAGRGSGRSAGVETGAPTQSFVTAPQGNGGVAVAVGDSRPVPSKAGPSLSGSIDMHNPPPLISSSEIVSSPSSSSSAAAAAAAAHVSSSTSSSSLQSISAAVSALAELYPPVPSLYLASSSSSSSYPALSSSSSSYPVLSSLSSSHPAFSSSSEWHPASSSSSSHPASSSSSSSHPAPSSSSSSHPASSSSSLYPAPSTSSSYPAPSTSSSFSGSTSSYSALNLSMKPKTKPSLDKADIGQKAPPAVPYYRVKLEVKPSTSRGDDDRGQHEAPQPPHVVKREAEGGQHVPSKSSWRPW